MRGMFVCWWDLGICMSIRIAAAVGICRLTSKGQSRVFSGVVG